MKTVPDLSPLRLRAGPKPKVAREYERQSPGGEFIAGEVDGVNFIVTQDRDGHTEVSLSCLGPYGWTYPPTIERCRAFFRVWGIPFPEGGESPAKGCRFWVVRQ